MKKNALLLILIACVSLVYAQTHIHVWVNGVETSFPIASVDSITFNSAEPDYSDGIGTFSVSDTSQVTFS